MKTSLNGSIGSCEKLEFKEVQAVPSRSVLSRKDCNNIAIFTVSIVLVRMNPYATLVSQPLNILINDPKHLRYQST